MSSIMMSPTKPKGRGVKLNMGTTGTMETTTRAGLSQTWVLASLVPTQNLVSE